MTIEPLAQGKTLGILGGGQLGRMIAQAAKRLGYRTAALDPSATSPAMQIVDVPVVASVNDDVAALTLAVASDVVTLEWELIATPVLEEVAKTRPLYPAPSVLEVIQDRLVQKNFLARHGFPQTPYGEVTIATRWTFPCVIKKRVHGYDGKGQFSAELPEDTPKAGEVLKEECIWESKVPFEREISVILARDREGGVAVYPVAENLHRGGILHATRAPARIDEATAEKAVVLARQIAEKLGHVGVMAVEMFLLKDGTLLINEIAPRVHNSGHYTLGGCAVSQFEQHVRAVCGLPLGETTLSGPATMVNLLGDLWEKGEPNWSSLDAVPNLVVHLYGKTEARRGRKMGHYTVVGANADEEFDRADERLQALSR
ncbi:MAG: 5-(carboxyamino)imidazole ribonucleotide synthase [Elusimicrobiota bacterium]